MRRHLPRRTPLSIAVTIALALVVVAGSTALAAGKALLKDILPGGGSSFGTSWETVNGRTLFFANDGVHGTELWITDGSRPGTRMLRDINRNGSSTASSGFIPLTKEVTLLTAKDADHGLELWRTDGTATGTRLVKDIYPGKSGSNISYWLSPVRGLALFLADDGQHGPELWRSDGTKAGTFLVKDIEAGADGQLAGYTSMWKAGGYLWIAAADHDHGRELWRSDGTKAGTRRIADLYPGPTGSNPTGVTVMNGFVYFTGDNGTDGYALFRSSGPGHVQLVKDIYPQPSGGTDYSSNIVALTRAGSLIYFIGFSGSADGSQVWKTDGTTNGTQVVRFLGPGPNGALPSHLTPYKNRLYFVARPGPPGGGTSLWRTDGDAANTVEIKVLSNRTQAVTNCGPMRYGGRLYFIVDDNNYGKELWASDGTTDGTWRLTDTNPGQADGVSRCPMRAGNGVYFAATGADGATEWWRSNGTKGGTVRLARFPGFPSAPGIDHVRNGIVFGTGDDGSHGDEPWVYRP